MRITPWIALASLLTLLAAPAASASSIFVLNLTPSLGTATDGTMTFANIGDPQPIAFSFGVNGNTYDNIITGAWNVSWSGTEPDQILGPVQPGIPSEIFPDVFVTSGSYTTTGGAGTMGFGSSVPEPGTGILFGLGTAMMVRRRRAASQSVPSQSARVRF